MRALYSRHEMVTQEMTRRGYCHRSPLDAALAQGDDQQTEFVDSYEAQLNLLRTKGCGCDVSKGDGL